MEVLKDANAYEAWGRSSEKQIGQGFGIVKHYLQKGWRTVRKR